MPNRAVIALAPLILERDDFFVLTLLQDFRSDLRSGNKRVPLRHILSIGKHQYIAEDRGLAGVDIQEIDIDRIAFRDAKLSATSLDNCVSHKVPKGKKPPKIPQTGRFDKWKAYLLSDGELRCHFVGSVHKFFV